MISPHCEKELTEFLNTEKRPGICWDFREIRSVVMCRAWEIMELEHKPFRVAIREAWDWVKEKCKEVGAYI
ncbi:MAG TPA: hypothetical protein ENG41_01395 [Methanomicrobia archaeon]|nr:hypothetical protein [Methanomicrobia archaeon]